MNVIDIIYTAQASGERLSEVEVGRLKLKFGAAGVDGADESIIVLPDRMRQEIVGFGGAFTEAMADTLQRMPEAFAREALEAYFHPERGIGYNFCRSHMNSCDFSLGNYDCLSEVNDDELRSFNIDRDKQYLVPLIRQALELCEEPFKLYISPWSPPGWMKTNGRMNHGGSLKREYYGIWARYYTKFIEAYANEGIPVWGLSLQNEPLAVTRWDNCHYTHAQERELCKEVSRELQVNGFSEVNIIVWDHNKFAMKERVDAIFNDLDAYEATYGVGFHWYGGNDTESTVDNRVLDYIHKCYPDKKLIFTEGCNPLREADNYIGEWWTGEKYGMHIIEDLNHYTSAWTDWNMVLDERGGPNHVGNFCDAPIIADTVKGELHYQSSYYYIGHFSKFIPEGARVAECRKQCGLQDLYVTVLQRPDGKWIYVVMNKSDSDRRVGFSHLDAVFTINMDPHSIATLVVAHG